MKINNATIYDLMTSIQKFNGAKGKTAFVLFRALRKLQDEIKDCDEQKNKLIQKYGKEMDNGMFGIDPEDNETNSKFFEEFSPILFYVLDIDIPKMSEKDFEALYDVDAPDANMNDYAIIDALLVQKPEDKKDDNESVPTEK